MFDYKIYPWILCSAVLSHGKYFSKHEKNKQYFLSFFSLTYTHHFPPIILALPKHTLHFYTSSEVEKAVARKTSKEFTSIKAPVNSRHCLVTGFFILSKAD